MQLIFLVFASILRRVAPSTNHPQAHWQRVGGLSFLDALVRQHERQRPRGVGVCIGSMVWTRSDVPLSDLRR